MATVHTGIRIDAEPAFNALEQTAPTLPTITRFFKEHGYETLMLQPEDSPKFGLTHEDIYRRDRRVEHDDIPYKGWRYGMAGIPDQYSLQFFAERYLSQARDPHFVFFMATSTHYDWTCAPPYARDWRQLDQGGIPDSAVVPWVPLHGRDRVAQGAPLFSKYFDDIEYEWRALADFIDARKEDALFVIVGDHQPLLACGDAPVTFNTPLHVLSRDRALIDRFAEVGLQPGLWSEPGQRPPLRHEGLYSLLVSRLAGQGAPYYPTGIALSSLRR
jgi:hypothetical protein